MLQARAVASECEKDLVGTLIPGKGPQIRVSESAGIKFCPWCGCDLTAWIEKNETLVRQLEEQSKNVSNF